jgi:hypothetical protein
MYLFCYHFCGLTIVPRVPTTIDMKNAMTYKESNGEIRKRAGMLLNASERVTLFLGCDNLAYRVWLKAPMV